LIRGRVRPPQADRTRREAVAVNPVGAVGGGADTTIDVLVVPERPPLSVTVRVATYVPGVE